MNELLEMKLTWLILVNSLLGFSHVDCHIIQSNLEHVKFKSVPPARVDVRRTGDIVLTCSVTGSPAPSVAWYRDDLFVYHEHEAGEAGHSLGETVARLRLSCISAKDVGQYECRASAGEQQVSAVTQVHVVDWDTGLCQYDNTPEIELWRPTLMVETGKSIALPCRSSSLGIVRTWTDTDGRAVDSSGHRDILPNGDLLLTQVSWSDMGEYTCTVSNQSGSASVKSFLYPLATEESRNV